MYITLAYIASRHKSISGGVGKGYNLPLALVDVTALEVFGGIGNQNLLKNERCYQHVIF